ncbi:MAG: class I SAM-dependent methyltransferase [Actinomycetota bacterium]
MGAPTELTFNADEPIPLTGERTAPGVAEENYWFQRHVVAYRWAAARIGGMRVLDAGSGEGYGTDILADTARRVVGVDLDAEIVRRAAAVYSRPGFQPANLVSLPFRNASFDAVVSLQVIEHLHTPHEFIAECARVMTPGGLLILSTPNRLTFSPEGTRNPFHSFEFAPDELRATVARHFSAVEILGTSHGPRVRTIERLLRGGLPERLIAQPAPEWPAWLRRCVARVRPGDFRVRSTHLERSLDLIATARA